MPTCSPVGVAHTDWNTVLGPLMKPAVRFWVKKPRAPCLTHSQEHAVPWRGSPEANWDGDALLASHIPSDFVATRAFQTAREGWVSRQCMQPGVAQESHTPKAVQLTWGFDVLLVHHKAWNTPAQNERVSTLSLLDQCCSLL